MDGFMKLVIILVVFYNYYGLEVNGQLISCEGSVYDAITMVPLSQVSVTFTLINENPVIQYATASSNLYGEYTMTELPSLGLYNVTVSLQGYYTLNRLVEINSNIKRNETSNEFYQVLFHLVPILPPQKSFYFVCSWGFYKNGSDYTISELDTEMFLPNGYSYSYYDQNNRGSINVNISRNSQSMAQGPEVVSLINIFNNNGRYRLVLNMYPLQGDYTDINKYPIRHRPRVEVYSFNRGYEFTIYCPDSITTTFRWTVIDINLKNGVDVYNAVSRTDLSFPFYYLELIFRNVLNDTNVAHASSVDIVGPTEMFGRSDRNATVPNHQTYGIFTDANYTLTVDATGFILDVTRDIVVFGANSDGTVKFLTGENEFYLLPSSPNNFAYTFILNWVPISQTFEEFSITIVTSKGCNFSTNGTQLMNDDCASLTGARFSYFINSTTFMYARMNISDSSNVRFEVFVKNLKGSFIAPPGIQAPRLTVYKKNSYVTNLLSPSAVNMVWSVYRYNNCTGHSFPNTMHSDMVFFNDCQLTTSVVTTSTPLTTFASQQSSTSRATTSFLITSSITSNTNNEISTTTITTNDANTNTNTNPNNNNKNETSTSTITSSSGLGASLTDSTSTNKIVIITSNSIINSDTESPDQKKNNKSVVIGASVAGSALMLAVIVMVVILVIMKMKKIKTDNGSYVDKDIELVDNYSSDFSRNCVIKYADLIVAKKIGSGAFGDVMKGEFRKTKVAIKQISSKKDIDTKVIDEFKLEAKTMSQISPHPNVVLFRGITLPPDPLCIILEYCKFGSLQKYLQSSATITDDEKIRFAKDIARGMLHLHTDKKGFEIIHRDLAARNILLKNGNMAAVSDFGMARIKDENEDTSKTSQMVGPLKWMSPESIVNHTYSIKSDVFSYGVVLYEIVTRKDPWINDNPVTAGSKVINKDRMDIPQDIPILAKIMELCWNHDPNERPTFSTILDLLKEKNEPEENLNSQSPTQNLKSTNESDYHNANVTYERV